MNCWYSTVCKHPNRILTIISIRYINCNCTKWYIKIIRDENIFLHIHIFLLNVHLLCLTVLNWFTFRSNCRSRGRTITPRARFSLVAAHGRCAWWGWISWWRWSCLLGIRVLGVNSKYQIYYHVDQAASSASEVWRIHPSWVDNSKVTLFKYVLCIPYISLPAIAFNDSTEFKYKSLSTCMCC